MLKFYEIDSITQEEVYLYNERGETMLYRANEPEPGYFIAESSKCVIRALEDKYVPVSLLIEDFVYKKYINNTNDNSISDIKMLNMLEACEIIIPVYILSHEKLTAAINYNITGGVLSLMHRRREADFTSFLDSFSNKDSLKLVVLDDVENPTNVGAIFRAAAALGADAVLLTDNGADPLYRRSLRVSMGTVFQIPWTIISKQVDYINILHEYGIKTAAMALTNLSVDIDDTELNSEKKLAIIMGNEGNGLPEATIKSSDYTVCIPMSHGVDSLNVAAASAVAIWQLCRNV